MREELTERFEQLGDRAALIDDDGEHRFRDLSEAVQRTRQMLRAHGVRPHDVLVIDGGFSRASIAAFFASFLDRLVTVPVASAEDRTLQAIVDACGPVHVLRAGPAPRIEALPAARIPDTPSLDRLRTAGAAGLVLLSSGSTGTPKLIVHDLDALVAQKLRKRPRGGSIPLRVLIVLMFDHIGGINSLLSTVLVGGCAVLPRTRTPEEVCRLVERHGIRVLPASPTFLNLVLVGGHHRRFDLSSLRMITYGTEPMTPELLDRVHAAFPGVRLLQTFGTSETGIATTVSESSQSTYFRISDSAVEYRIVDGELQLRSETQFLGYLNADDDVLTEDGWFRTGDLVEEADDGYIRVVGRATELINVGGEKLVPLELESILLASPLVQDCVVYGAANALTGQVVCADIAPTKPVSRSALRRHIRTFLRGRVEEFKVPTRINVVESVPASDRFKKVRSSGAGTGQGSRDRGENR